MRFLGLLGVLAGAFPAMTLADIQADFIESAPKDRFVLTNTSGCGLTDLRIELDLSTSKAGLIFDVTDAGAGVEVFQPFELVRGADLVASAPRVTDGMNKVTLDVPNFPKGAEIAFTVDVDDTLASSDLGQIRVSGSEISGATLRVANAVSAFDSTGRAEVSKQGCSA